MRRDIVPRLSRARADRAAAFSSARAPRGGRPSDAALDGGAVALRDLFEVILICPILSGRIFSSGWFLPTRNTLVGTALVRVPAGNTGWADANLVTWMRRDIVPRLSRACADCAAAFFSAHAPRGGRPSDAVLDGGAAALRSLFEVIQICQFRSGRIFTSGWFLPTRTTLVGTALVAVHTGYTGCADANLMA